MALTSEEQAASTEEVTAIVEEQSLEIKRTTEDFEREGMEKLRKLAVTMKQANNKT